MSVDMKFSVWVEKKGNIDVNIPTKDWDSAKAKAKELIAEDDVLICVARGMSGGMEMFHLTYTKEVKYCPRCGNPMSEYPAISRRYDIEICSSCGAVEALEDAGMVAKMELCEWIEPPLV